MSQRLSLPGTVVLLLIATDAAASNGPAVITNVSPHGPSPVTISEIEGRYDANIGAWPDVAAFGCTFLHVDIDVRDGGTLTATYNVRELPGSDTWADSYLDIYLLEPGVTWNPGTTWNESGTEICWRYDAPPGVVWIEREVNAPPPDFQTSDLELRVSLDQYRNQSVRLVFRHWSWGDYYGVFDETIQTRVRDLTVGGAPRLTVEPSNAVTRGGTVTFRLHNVPDDATISNWSFTTQESSRIERNSDQASDVWSGTIVESGTATVRVVYNGQTYDPVVDVTVIPRDWAWPTLDAIKVPNGTMMTLPSPPSPGSALGFSRLDLRYVFNSQTVSDGGPNHGLLYVASLVDTNDGIPSSFRWQLVQDLDNATTAFYVAQCGNYNPITKQGFISGKVLKSNTIEHEAGSTLGHYQQYVVAHTDENNIGRLAERKVGDISMATAEFVQVVRDELNRAIERVTSAMEVEACNADVRRDATCVTDYEGSFRGFINHQPYKKCR